MADKPKMKYKVVTGKNPRTGETMLRPQIVERETYYIDQVIEYALNAGYIRGQFEDSKGTVNGFIEAIQALGKAGKAVNIANWLRVHAELTGSVGEDRTLTDANELHVNITALTDLQSDVSNFSWTNTDDTGLRVKVETVMANGGTPGYIAKDKEIVVTGKNLQFNAALGDAITVEYDGLTTPISVVPTESDYAHQKIAWPAALDELEDGAPVTFKFKLRGGVEGAPDQVVTKIVVYKAA